MAATADNARCPRSQPAADVPSSLQHRYVEAWQVAGQIMIDAIQTVVQHQAELAEQGMRELWSDSEAVWRADPGDYRPAEQLERLHDHYRRTLGGLQEVAEIMLKAQSEAMQVLAEGALAGAEEVTRKAA